MSAYHTAFSAFESGNGGGGGGTSGAGAGGGGGGVDGAVASAAGDAVNDTYDYQMAAASTSQEHMHQNIEAKLKDMPDKYFMAIAHFLAGNINDTEAIERYNGPLLKTSIKSVYWIFLVQYAALALVGIVTNLAIIAYVMYHRLFKDVTHAFIVNLALCHFVQCALVLPVTLFVMLMQNWIFGQFMCFFLPMLQDIPLHVAMISHILIAWDRMRWLGDPLQGRLPAFVCCCATWLTGMVIALPYPIYTIYVEIGDYVPRLDGIGLCVVNLMDDMHEYMRGLFLIMYCAPTVLLAYLYIRTSQELRPPDGPFAVMMFEHRADVRNRQRNSSASSVDRSYNGASSGAGGGVTTTTSTTTGIGSSLNTHTNVHSPFMASASAVGSTATKLSVASARTYDLYSAELDVYREKRKQRNFGSMAAAQVVCLCPLMVLRFARLSMEETYENQKHFDFTYLMFVWIAFLPTVIFPCIYASQILPRTEQERLRGYFRLSSKRLYKWRGSSADDGEGGGGGGGGHTPSSREDSIEKDENTNTTQATSIIVNGDEFGNGICAGTVIGTALVTRQELQRAARHQQQQQQQHQHQHQQQHHNGSRHGRDKAMAGAATGASASVTASKQLSKDARVKKNDVKIKVISDGKSKAAGNGVPTRQPKSGSMSSRRESAGDSVPASTARKLTLGSLDNSCSNMTSSTYCNGNSTLLDDGGASNFGDGEDSSIVSGMIVASGNGAPYYQKKWSASGQSSLRHKNMSFSDCSSFSQLDSASTLERDLEIIDLLERERSMDLQEMMEREKHGETVRLSGERRRLPDIEKIYQRSPKPKTEPYSYDKSQSQSQSTTASTASAKDTTTPHTVRTTMPLGSDPLQANSNEGYSVASTLNEDDAAHMLALPHDDDDDSVSGVSSGVDVGMDEEVPPDFFDKYTPGSSSAMPMPSSAPPITPTAAAYQYQYSRRLSRKSSHHSQSSHRASKRDSFNSLNGSDLIAGAFGELDPTQPLTKMSVIENRMRRSSGGRTSSFSSSARSSMKSRDYSHGSSHSAHPELDFRENIFAEL